MIKAIILALAAILVVSLLVGCFEPPTCENCTPTPNPKAEWFDETTARQRGDAPLTPPTQEAK